MGRPTQYPRQLLVSVTEEQGERIDTLAAGRPDGSKSAALRRLIALGELLEESIGAEQCDAYGSPWVAFGEIAEVPR